MQFVSDNDVDRWLTYPELIPALRNGFSRSIKVPDRHHHTYASGASDPSTLLLMPAWEDEQFVGVKLVTVSPDNGAKNLPVIHGLYQLFNAIDGTPLMTMDARLLTTRRTAATSALASSFLSREDASVLLMIGTGALARELIPAHASIRPLRKVLIWGRNREKARVLSRQIRLPNIDLVVCDDISRGIEEADIISSATVSSRAVIEGKWLRAGQHIDLVGSYRPDMRESDNDVIRRSRVFVDSKSTAPIEAGDLVMPMRDGLLAAEDIVADLFALCRGQHDGRRDADSITLFKSVGHALEDLVAARLIYSNLKGADHA